MQIRWRSHWLDGEIECLCTFMGVALYARETWDTWGGYIYDHEGD